MRLRPDLVLVALPTWSAVERRRGSVLLPTITEHDRAGVVLLTGAAVTEVAVADKVIFDSYAAEDVSLSDGLRAVLVPEKDIDAVVE